MNADMRKELDEIDDGIAKLFLRRMELVGSVADPERERQSLSRAVEIVGEDHVRDVKMLFDTLSGLSAAQRRRLHGGKCALTDEIVRAASESRPLPEKTLVACQGTEGSYSQQAASLMFQAPTIVFMRDFESVFEIVEKGMCPYGILPIENSSAGSVAQVYDLMVKHHFHIVKSVRVKIDHALLGCRGSKLSEIREITSHPHALSQCGAFLKGHSGIRPVPAENTAIAAKQLAANGPADRAVIASRACADIYGLDILADGVADNTYNFTRFICIARDLQVTPDATKFSIMLTLPHRPGSLNAIISKFAAAAVNLTKLESRPIPGMDFEFLFTFEFEASPTNPAVLAILAELSQNPEIERFAFLGAYA